MVTTLQSERVSECPRLCTCDNADAASQQDTSRERPPLGRVSLGFLDHHRCVACRRGSPPLHVHLLRGPAFLPTFKFMHVHRPSSLLPNMRSLALRFLQRVSGPFLL